MLTSQGRLSDTETRMIASITNLNKFPDGHNTGDRIAVVKVIIPSNFPEMMTSNKILGNTVKSNQDEFLKFHAQLLSKNFCNVQFSRSVVSNSLRPHELQHARPPCPSQTPGVHPNPCPLSRWCLQPSHPLSSPSPALNLFQYQGLYESALHIRWPKYWSFSFNISPSNEHQGLISFRMDWLDLLAVQGTLKSLLQHHSSKHQFFWAHLSL